MQPKNAHLHEVPADVRQTVIDLRIADDRTKGQPVVPAEDIEKFRDYLGDVLIDTALRMAHTDLLSALYKGPFNVPRPRRDLPEGARSVRLPTETVFRHHELLLDDVAQAVQARGLEVLSPADLARLALNPFALWDLADSIDEVLPDRWLDRMEARGRLLMDESAYEEVLKEAEEDLIALQRSEVGPRAEEPARSAEARLLVGAGTMRGATPTEALGSDCWRLTFADEISGKMARVLAERMYDDASRQFELRLYRLAVRGRADQVELELEVLPAPTKADLTIRIIFEGEVRDFTVEVPPELKIDPSLKPRDRMRSEPCAPVDRATFKAPAVAEWQEGSEPPTVKLGD